MWGFSSRVDGSPDHPFTRHMIASAQDQPAILLDPTTHAHRALILDPVPTPRACLISRQSLVQPMRGRSR
jgi:hypothetical protein